MSTQSREVLLKHLQHELCSIPLEHWGHFFPCLVATWRFIEELRPSTLGALNCGYDASVPWFRGKGSRLFDSIRNSEIVVECYEKIMDPLATAIPEIARNRGFLLVEELPDLDINVIEDLSEFVLDVVDK